MIILKAEEFYYTYSLAQNGSKYEIYFDDKAKSKNPSKVLIEK